jgi:DNA-binding transcriptional regulator GbsR (MarR family)
MKDVFQMFRVISRERKKREIDPTVDVLGECIAELSKVKPADTYIRDRLSDLLKFFELANTAYAQMETLPTPALLKLARMGHKGLKLLGVTPK